MNGLKLTDGQYDALRGLQGGEGLFLLVQGGRSVVAQLPMRGLDSFIAVLSAREEDLRRMDRLRAQPAGADVFEAFHREKEAAA